MRRHSGWHENQPAEFQLLHGILRNRQMSHMYRIKRSAKHPDPLWFAF
jgi:hypothetical protein